MTKIAFFETKSYDKEFFSKENKSFDFKITYFEEHLYEKTVELAKGFDIVCAFVNDKINDKVIEALHKLNVRLIALRCSGYNNVNLESAKKYNIKVVRVPVYSPYAVAEHAVALMLALNRKICLARSRIRDNNFSIEGLLGFDMYGKTAGIIGTGKIGQVLIDILNGFGMKILAYDVHQIADPKNFTYTDLDSLFKNSDIISLHCPLTPQTQHIINEDSIAKMKPGVMLINTGRGKLVDTKSLIKGLKSTKISYAGLDVYEEEENFFFENLSDSFIPDDVLARLQTFPNVLITSHQAFFTKEAVEIIAKTTLENIQAFVKGKPLKNEIYA